jgi:hypothetical protein
MVFVPSLRVTAATPKQKYPVKAIPKKQSIRPQYILFYQRFIRFDSIPFRYAPFHFVSAHFTPDLLYIKVLPPATLLAIPF